MKNFFTFRGGENMKKRFLIGISLIMMLLLIGCGKSEYVKKTETSISAIGTVTINSGEFIKQAEMDYNALTEKDKSKVENYQTLVSAREEYDKLVCESIEESINALYSKCLEIEYMAEYSSTIVMEYWTTKTYRTPFSSLWKEDDYQYTTGPSSAFNSEVKKNVKTFWELKDKITNSLDEAEQINKSISIVPDEKKDAYSAVKELYIAVSTYAKQSITFPDGYSERSYSSYINSTLEEIQSLISRVEIELQ